MTDQQLAKRIDNIEERLDQIEQRMKDVQTGEKVDHDVLITLKIQVEILTNMSKWVIGTLAVVGLTLLANLVYLAITHRLI